MKIVEENLYVDIEPQGLTPTSRSQLLYHSITSFFFTYPCEPAILCFVHDGMRKISCVPKKWIEDTTIVAEYDFGFAKEYIDKLYNSNIFTCVNLFLLLKKHTFLQFLYIVYSSYLATDCV